MIFAKVGTAMTALFGPVLATDDTMSNGALAYTDFTIVKNGVDTALDASFTATHDHEGQYLVAFTASDLDAVGDYTLVLNKNPLRSEPLRVTVLAASVYNWFFGTLPPLTDKSGFSITGTIQTLDSLTSSWGTPVTAGAGATPCTLTVHDINGVAMPECAVWLTTDLVGSSLYAGTLYTNSAGQVTFQLTTGNTYYVWRLKGGYNFSNPQTWSI
jgi:hypothetical protein